MTGTGTHKAISAVLKLRNKHPWVLKTDLTAFFDNIHRADLLSILKRKLKKSSLMPLLEQIVNAEVLIKDHETKMILETNGITAGKGLRQGMPLSPLLSNVFLNRFDRFAIKKQLNIVRYVDDIAIFCNSEDECLKQQMLIEKVINDIKFTIPSLNELDSKTQIKKPDESIIFLGVEIYKGNNGEYLLRIPEKSVHEILSNLDEYTCYKYVLENKLDYSSLARRLNNKLSGYKAAYKDTTNRETFLQRFSEKTQKVKDKLLRSVLGDAFFSALTADKRKFFGIN